MYLTKPKKTRNTKTNKNKKRKKRRERKQEKTEGKKPKPMAQQYLPGAVEGKVAFRSFVGWDWTRVAETPWLRLRAQAAKGGLVSYCCCNQFPHVSGLNHTSLSP